MTMSFTKKDFYNPLFKATNTVKSELIMKIQELACKIAQLEVLVKCKTTQLEVLMKETTNTLIEGFN